MFTCPHPLPFSTYKPSALSALILGCTHTHTHTHTCPPAGLKPTKHFSGLEHNVVGKDSFLLFFCWGIDPQCQALHVSEKQCPTPLECQSPNSCPSARTPPPEHQPPSTTYPPTSVRLPGSLPSLHTHTGVLTPLQHNWAFLICQASCPALAHGICLSPIRPAGFSTLHSPSSLCHLLEMRKEHCLWG
jgi:hypothetical protein